MMAIGSSDNFTDILQLGCEKSSERLNIFTLYLSLEGSQKEVQKKYFFIFKVRHAGIRDTANF